MWSTWGRWRRAAAVIAAIFVALVAVGALFPTDVLRTEIDRDRVTLTFFQERDDEELEPLLRDDFSHATGAWNERREDGAVVTIRDGALQVRLLEEGTFDFEAPHATVGELDAVHVEASVRIEAGGPAAVVGLFCAVSGGADAELVGAAGGYVFLVHPESGVARIGRVPAPLQAGFAKAVPIAQADLPEPWPHGTPKVLAAGCGGADGALTFAVDGHDVASAPSRASGRRFDSAGVAVLHAGEAREVVVSFDDYLVRPPSR
jgi:hypothetical protein